ncbi:MAG: ribonuclease HI family protein [Candidatus Brocadiaceae bacterium]|nr:ribonuclease HI family protein [Candidatus Brocadiaceae bacterium]
MDKHRLLRAVYEAVDWSRLYNDHPDVTRQDVDALFRELGAHPAVAPEPAASEQASGAALGKEAHLFTDGASRGNPGPAGIGMVLKTPDGRTAAAWGEPIGRTTNNVAEYRAVIAGLRRALELGVARVHLFSDSELLVRQLQGTYRVRNARLRPLYDEATALLGRFAAWTVRHVPREENSEADALATRGAGANRA